MSLRSTAVLIFLWMFLTWDAQASEVSVPVSVGLQKQIYSNLLNEQREYYLSLPRSYVDSPGKKYPLLVTFDAESLFRVTASLVESLSSSGAVPEMIVVSIKNTDRWRDLTPIADPSFPTSGGGAKFLEFVGTELIPTIEKKWRVGKFRILAGHSLGGLMAYYDLAHGRRSFDAYLAISPTLSILESNFETGVSKLVSLRSSRAPFAYFAMANETNEEVNFDRLRAMTSDSKLLATRFEKFSFSDDHHSIRAPALLSGLRWLFSDYRLLPHQLLQMSDEELDTFYVLATKKFKEPMEIAVMELTNAAYWGLTSLNTQQRALKLFKLAVAKWPNNAYAWSCMAEGFERTNQIQQAKDAIAKAIQLGQANGFDNMPYLQAIKNSIDLRYRVPSFSVQ